MIDPSSCVLIAEDNKDDAFLMQRAFKEQGLMRPPIIVEDGEQAIACITGTGIYADRALYPMPNLLILDLKMPRVDGFGVLQWLQEHPDWRVIPTIVWSSSNDQRDVKHAYCLGANGYLIKPTDFGEFKKMLGRMLAFWGDCLRPVPTPLVPNCSELKNAHPFSGSPAPAPDVSRR